MRKLIAVDLDGTLLNWRKKVSDRTINTLIKAQKEGHVVMIATGRPYDTSINYAKELQLDKFGGYMSNFNGGLITNIKTGDKIQDIKFELDLLREIIGYIDKLGVDYSILHDNNLYTNYHSRLIFRIYRKIIGQNVIRDESHNKYIDFSVNKILLNDWMGNLKNTMKKINDKFGDKIETSFSSSVSIEITPKETSKGQSILEVAKIEGVDEKDTIAFGNYGNDLSMMRLGGIGVAMKNSSKEILEASDYITDTNNREGISKYIEKYVL